MFTVIAFPCHILSHHRRLDSPAPKYMAIMMPRRARGKYCLRWLPTSWCPTWLSVNIVDSPCLPPPPPPTKYLSSNQSRCIARLAKSPSTRDNNALCVLLFTAQIDFFFLQLSFVNEWPRRWPILEDYYYYYFVRLGFGGNTFWST